MNNLIRLSRILILTKCMVFAPFGSAFAANNIYDGHWRGELALPSNVKLAIGIEVSDMHSKLTISSPNQGMHNRVPSAFSINDNTISFTDEGLKASFKGTINGDTINGTFTQGKARPLKLKKLSVADTERLKFEGKYIGDLQINKNTTLPLVLHVAVIANGFSATLDSPSQNSFGIPIDSITLNDSKLGFTSSMLGAKYEGEAKNNDSSSDLSYTGVFIQGVPLPLSLTKVGANNAHLQFTPAEFGDKGGSIAIVSHQGLQTRFFNAHTRHSQYEIGSITKTYIGLLLAQRVIEGQIGLNTSVDKYFPKAPAISLVSLATHTSGLERLMPSLHNNVDPANPYAHITRALLASDLANGLQTDTKQIQDTPTKKPHLYSNFGFAVLGESLAIEANKSLSDLIQSNIFEPLQMQSSYLALKSEQVSTGLVQGYNSAGKAVPAWSFGAASGAGAIVSTLNDMIGYAKYMMSLPVKNPTLANLLFTSYGPMANCCQQGLAWVLMSDENGKEYAWHNGMTGGYSAFVGFYLDGSRAVVMLNNQATSFDDIAHGLLQDKITLQSI